MNLCVDPKNAMKSEFGVDYECYADRTALTGKLGLVVSEMSGLSTPSTLAKPDNPVYGWNMVLASDPAQAEDTRTLPQPPWQLCCGHGRLRGVCAAAWVHETLQGRGSCEFCSGAVRRGFRP